MINLLEAFKNEDGFTKKKFGQHFLTNKSMLDKIIEAAAHICGGENYLLGVLFYTVLPVSAGYFTFAGTYIIYMYNKKFKEKIMHAFVYFLFASAFGLVLLIKAYNCGDL